MEPLRTALWTTILFVGGASLVTHAQPGDTKAPLKSDEKVADRLDPLARYRPKPIDIYAQQRVEDGKDGKDKTYNFFMWIDHGNVRVLNTAPSIAVGYDMDGAVGLYLESKKAVMASGCMFFVHSYTKGKGFEDELVVEFGGSREDDIHVYLPEGRTATTRFSNFNRFKN